MTGHSRLPLLITVSCLAATCGGGTPVPTSPSGQQSFLTGTWTGTLTIDREGEPSTVRCSDVDIRPVDRHEPPDIYRHDSIAEPVVADDRERYERYHSVESAARPHQHHRQLSVSSRLHRDDAQRRHGRSHEYRRRFLRRRLCLAGAVDIPWPRRVIKDRIIAVPIDRAAPLTFLRTAFHEDDWVAVFLKSYQSAVSRSAFARCSRFRARGSRRGCAPRTRPERTFTSPSMPWHHISARGAASPSARFDTSSSTLTALLRRFLTRLRLATELPSPSYVMRSSPGRAHLFWRVSRFTCDTVEALEKHLARKLGTDPAATACTQVTRLPGFVNHKRATPYVVSIEYRDRDRVYEPADFPKPPPRLTTPAPTPVVTNGQESARSGAAVHRRHSTRHLWTARRRPHVPRVLSRCQGVRVGGRRGTRRAARVEQPLRAALVRA